MNELKVDKTNKLKQGDVVYSWKLKKVVKVVSEVLTNEEVCTLKNLPITRAGLIENKYYKLVDKDNNIYVEDIGVSSNTYDTKESVLEKIKDNADSIKSDVERATQYSITYNEELNKKIETCTNFLKNNKTEFQETYNSKLSEKSYKLTKDINRPTPYKVGKLYVSYDKDGWGDTRIMLHKYLGCLDDTFAIKKRYIDIDDNAEVHIFALVYDSIDCWRDDVAFRVRETMTDLEPFQEPLKEFTQKELDRLTKKLEKEKEVKQKSINNSYDKREHKKLIVMYGNILKEIRNFNV